MLQNVAKLMGFAHCACCNRECIFLKIGLINFVFPYFQVVSTNWPQPHYQLLISGLCRVRVEEIINLDPFPTAKVAQHSWKGW